jgi:L-serine dehydratase
MAPRRAAEIFLHRNPECSYFRVTLYGSLAATGKGHLTDQAIFDVLRPHGNVELIWEPSIFKPFHPNGMRFEAVEDDHVVDDWTVYSVGGGALAEENSVPIETADIYPDTKLVDILKWCTENGRTFWEYVELHEGKDIWIFLAKIWRVMREAVERGIETDGVIPGPLNLPRRAMRYNVRASGYKQSLQSRGLIFSYALAVSEENASGGRIVTAPTCG